MTKASAIKQLDTIIGKLSKLNYHIDGDSLGTAIREVVYVKDGLQTNKIETRKNKK